MQENSRTSLTSIMMKKLIQQHPICTSLMKFKKQRTMSRKPNYLLEEITQKVMQFSEHWQKYKKYVIQQIHYKEENNEQKSEPTQKNFLKKKITQLKFLTLK